MNADATREIIAREIWGYNESPWDFNNPPEGMAKLQKQMAVDQAERIRAALEKAKVLRGKSLARFVFQGR